MALSRPRLEFTCAEAADPGARAYQEDTIRVWQDNEPAGRAGRSLLAVLSDGMGGHVSGETASRLAASRYVDIVKSNRTDNIEKLLERALTLSNDAISEEVRKNAALKGMGCTLVAAYLDGDGLRWVSVGDSALLHYRNGTLTRLNDDHSLGSLLDRQAQAKLITEEEAKSDPRRRVLRSALIGGTIAVADIRIEPTPLEHGDWIIVASDGLETLSGNDICEILRQQLSEDAHPKIVAGALLDAVRRRRAPNQDNVSIVVTRVSDPLEVETRIVARKAVAAPSITQEITQPIEGVAGDAGARINGGGPLPPVISDMIPFDHRPGQGASGPVETQRAAVPTQAASAGSKSSSGQLVTTIVMLLAVVSLLALVYLWPKSNPSAEDKKPAKDTTVQSTDTEIRPGSSDARAPADNPGELGAAGSANKGAKQTPTGNQSKQSGTAPPVKSETKREANEPAAKTPATSASEALRVAP